MSSFWNWWVIGITVVNILACFWLIRWTMKSRPGEAAEGDVTGHVWDGLEELNNPLPRWWLWLFYGTLIFAFSYLALYPGLGNFKGVLGWTQENQWEAEMKAAEEQYGPIFKKFASQDIETLAKDPEALDIGRRLYLNYCALCHGSDAQGAKGFPNLADDAWMYGGTPEQIKASILNGRNGMMPALGAALGGDEGVKAVAAYVASLSGRKIDPALAEKGKEKFAAACAACHMPDGTGNQALGAPNLTDKSWIYGSTMESIEETIRNGRQGKMPAHKDFLGEDKVHLLTAYIYSLSHK